jgi:hypothetical protein
MNHVKPCGRSAACASAALLLCACLELPDDGDQLYSSYIVPADADVPLFEADEAAAKKLDLNKGFSGSTIPLHTGFAGGELIEYWDLGTLAAASAKPMWIFRHQGSDISSAGRHPNLIDSIPGDTAYTPLRQLYIVTLNQSWDGERITSLRALEDAVEFGLVASPVAQNSFVNCVVVLSTTTLQVSREGESKGPDPTYYRGKEVSQFCLQGFEPSVGAFELKDGQFTPGNAYLLRRENESQPLDESVVKKDLNGNESLLDSNVVFDSNVGGMGYTSVWKSLDVLVPRNYMFGDSKSQDDLFEKKDGGLAGKPDRVIQYRDNAVFLNRPIKRVLP